MASSNDTRTGAGTAIAIGLGTVWLIVTRLLVAWNGIIGPDGARDLATAARILRGEGFPLHGPLHGLTFHLHLGPLYYYVVALSLWLFQTATGVMSSLALVSAVSAFFAYRTGTLLFDRRTGFLFACLLAGDFVAALPAFQLSNSSLVLPVGLALVSTSLSAIVHRRPGYLGFALPLAAAALQIHPTTVALLPLVAAAMLLPTDRGKLRALAVGSAGVLLLSAPSLVYEFTHRGETLERATGVVGSILARGGELEVAAIPEILSWAAFLSPTVARHLSEGVTPAWLRSLALVLLHGVALGAIAGFGRTIAGVFQPQTRRSSLLLLCWIMPWWLMIPTLLSTVAWWHLYPILSAFLLFAARGLAWLFDHLPAPEQWRRVAMCAFGVLAFVVPAWLATATFQRVANEGLVHLPPSLFWRRGAPFDVPGGFVYPTIGVRREERMIQDLLRDSGCNLSLLHRLHGHPLWLTLQSRGFLLQLHQPRCTAPDTTGPAMSFVGLRKSDLPPGFEHSMERRGAALVILRQRTPGPLDARYSTEPRHGWEAPEFDDRTWEPLRLPAVQMPNPVAYPAAPDMTWSRSPIFVRANLAHWGTGPVLLGVAFPSAAPWLYQGRVNGLFVNGKAAPLPRVQAPYLLLYDLTTQLRPGDNLLGLEIGGEPHFTLDLFAFIAEP